jgi:hypothetical protein
MTNSATITTTVEIPRALHKRLKILAVSTERTLNQVFLDGGARELLAADQVAAEVHAEEDGGDASPGS